MVTRHERVVLELEDRFSRPTGQAAAASKGLERALHDLDGTSVKTRASVTGLEKPIANIDRGGRLADRSINQLTGRLRLLTDVALTLGPALVPLGAGGFTAVAGLTAQFGALAGGIGVAVLALNGVGDAVKAVNEYQLEPTADNLAKVAEELKKLGPAGANFVIFLEQISPQLRELQELAREGALPGLADGIEDFLARGPQLNNIVGELAATLGDLSASAGESLGGERFDAFFDYLDREAGPLLMEFGRSVGNVAEGLANMMVAFAPVSSDFSGGLQEMTRAFADWSAGLQTNASFQEFLDYLRDNGPAAVDFLGSFVQALASLVDAAAPVGQAVLPVLTAILDAFGAIAGTPVGTAILGAAAAFAFFNRTASMLSPVLSQVQLQLHALADKAFPRTADGAGKAAGSLSKLDKAALAVGGIMLLTSALKTLQDRLDGTLPTTEQLTGRLIDLADGRVANLGADFDQMSDSIGRLTDANFFEDVGDGVLGVLGLEGNRLKSAREEMELLDDSLTNLANTGGVPEATAAFDALVAAQGLSADEAQRLLTLLPNYGDALNRAENEAKLAGGSHEQLAVDLDTATTSLDAMRNALQSARELWKESRQEARGVAQTFVNLGESLNDSEVSLSGWIRQLEQNAEALQRFQANAQRAARRGLDQGLIQSLRDAGTEGALRMRQLANATDAEIDRANGAWRKGQGAVKDFVREVAGVKPRYVTRLEAQVQQALAEIARLKAALDLPDEYVSVWVTRRTVNPAGGPGPQPVTGADGMTVPGRRLPYGDKVHAFIAPGEEVISNRHGQADRHRALLKAINANRLAGGSTVRSHMESYQRQHQATAPAAGGTSVRVAMPSLDGLRIVGTLQTPWGPAEVEGIARGAARREVDAYDRDQRIKAGG